MFSQLLRELSHDGLHDQAAAPHRDTVVVSVRGTKFCSYDVHKFCLELVLKRTDALGVGHDLRTLLQGDVTTDHSQTVGGILVAVVEGPGCDDWEGSVARFGSGGVKDSGRACGGACGSSSWRRNRSGGDVNDSSRGCGGDRGIGSACGSSSSGTRRRCGGDTSLSSHSGSR